ncbi:LOW QUALITY PROTEIN: protein brambleberry-like [Haliotis rubra]|uniref:LOW QUALITY PROTEIN: protein brambleberry-like n=1 Tax=Haliotis rubra TaxID=36100 RepID=UPI001EE598FB|nr:LOW QUALITY PROTEIN: protein brambleberry-like [Haliotis rubra]
MWRPVNQIYFVLTLYFTIYPSQSVLEWLFGSDSQQKENGDVKQGSGARFEVISTDEHFLEFAKTLKDLSTLDACNQIVVFNLRKKCGDLSEEELGKLAVQLLNCQSEAEHRPVFPCTSSMTLASCTKPMDTTTWNTYQIVSNRARAMCYEAQQTQFHRLTEATVNNLMTSAHGQTEVMKELKDGQEQLHLMTTETIRKLFESQQELLITHQSLQSAQEGVFTHIKDNIQELTKEKSLIATGNKELASMTQKIKQELDLTREQLQDQESAQRQNHQTILEDLKNIHSRAKDAFDKLDSSTKHLLTSHNKMTANYEEMFSNLQKINTTVTSLLGAVAEMQENMERKIGWISQLLGGADDKLQLLTSCVFHIAYFLLMVVAAAFLHLPLFSRFLLLIVIVSNAAAEISYSTSLDFAGMTAFIFSTSMAYWALTWIRSNLQYNSSPGSSSSAITFSPSSSGQSAPLSSDELRELTSTLGRLYNTMTDSLNQSTSQPCAGDAIPDVRTPQEVPRNNVQQPDSTIEEVNQVRRVLLNQLGGETPNRSSPARFSSGSRTPISGTPQSSRASTPSLASRCLAITRTGAPCRMQSMTGQEYCHRHFRT